MNNGNLKAEMARVGMTGADAQRLLNMSRSSWHRRLTGQIKWRKFEILKLVRELRTRNGEMNESTSRRLVEIVDNQLTNM